MWPLKGPHLSLVTQTWPPLELSTFWGIQTIGLPGSVGGGLRLLIGWKPRKPPGSTRSRRDAGTHSPWLSASVISPFGPAPRPLELRTPVARTSSSEPSLLTRRTVPPCSVPSPHLT